MEIMEQEHLPTHIVATGAATSPYWLHNLSDTATTVLPILGVLWLLIQAGVYIHDTYRNWKKQRADDRKD